MNVFAELHTMSLNCVNAINVIFTEQRVYVQHQKLLSLSWNFTNEFHIKRRTTIVFILVL